jgi:hypothetical protein
MSEDLMCRVIQYLDDVAGGTEHREKAEPLAGELAAELNSELDSASRHAERDELLREAEDMLGRTYICGERICCQYCDATAVGRTKHHKDCEYGQWIARFAELEKEGE